MQKAAKADRASNSFEAVAGEWLAKYSPRWAASHSGKIIQRLQNDVFPWIGARPIADIAPPDVLKVLHRIEGRGAHDTAHRALQNCGQVFRYGVATGRLMSDARTILHQEMGIAPEVIEHQLAHRVPDVLGTAYNRTKFIKERRKMMQVWADYLDKLKTSADVIPIQGQAA